MGAGKTIIALEAIQRLREATLAVDGGAVSKYDVLGGNLPLVLVPKKAKVQWLRHIRRYGLEGHVVVMSHEELRCTNGELYVSWVSKVRGDQIDIVPEWDELTMPRWILFDESHKAKNPDSQLCKILADYVRRGGVLHQMSGTPYILFSETYLVCLGLGLCTDRESWRALLTEYGIGTRYEPDKPHPTIMERFNNDLENFGGLIKVRKVVFKHRIKTVYTELPLEGRKREIYNRAYDEFLIRVRYPKAGRGYNNPWLEKAIAIKQFHRCAEALRSDELAKRAIDAVNKGRQCLVFFSYIGGQRLTFKCLQKMGYDMNKVGLLWGCSSDKENQKAVDLFQAGKLDILLASLKKGGDSLDLNHSTPKGRPRTVLSGVTFSGVDFAQMAGRGHRVNSISTTYMEVVTFERTAESRVVEVLQGKTESLASLIGRKASFASLFIDGTLDTGAGKDEYMTCADNEEDREEAREMAESLPLGDMLDEESPTTGGAVALMEGGGPSVPKQITY